MENRISYILVSKESNGNKNFNHAIDETYEFKKKRVSNQLLL